MGKRYILEATWSGCPLTKQGITKIYHRQVIYGPEKYKNLKAIEFIDGTHLNLSIKPCLPKERVKEILGYGDLISSCLSQRVSSVAQLQPEPF